MGIPYLNTAAANSLTAGLGTGLASANTEQLYQDYIAMINAAGGILGHKVVGEYFQVSPSTPTTQIDQEVCNNFTQDHPVQFVFAQEASTVLFPCLSQAGVADIADGIGDENSTAELAPDSLLLMPQTVTLDRLARVEVPRLVSDGYLGSGTKLGVLYYSNEQASVDGLNALKSSLAAKHLSITESVGITKASGTADLASMEASVQSAVLKFKTEGVNHVMCEEGTPYMCGFFPIYASDQDYYPRYAFNSSETLTALTANDSIKALTGSVAITWFPASDLQTQSLMPARTRACLAFFEAKGIAMTTGNEKDAGLTTCEDLTFLKAALEKAPALTAKGLVAGAQALVTSYPAVGTFGIQFKPGQHDGVRLFSEAAFNPSCDCFKYTSSPTAG